MVKEGKEWMIAQAYAGMITFILNFLILWFFIGNVKTSDYKHQLIVNLAFCVIICSLIYCFLSSILMSDAIFGIHLTDEICYISFRLTYIFLTIQRFFLYLFFIFRLRSLYIGTPFEMSKRSIYILVIMVSVSMTALLLSWISLYPVHASYDGKYSECTTTLDDDSHHVNILIISAIVLADMMVGITTLVYFVRRLFMLIPDTENVRWYYCLVCRCCRSPTLQNGDDPLDEMNQTAFRALRYGIIAIVSTLIFYIMAAVVDSFGHILQIDSFINSFCIVAVFRWNYDNFFMQYGLWWMWIKQKNARKNLEMAAVESNTKTRTKSVGSVPKLSTTSVQVVIK